MEEPLSTKVECKDAGNNDCDFTCKPCHVLVNVSLFVGLKDEKTRPELLPFKFTVVGIVLEYPVPSHGDQ